MMGFFRSQFRGFSQYMAESNRKGLTFAVFRGKQNISESELGDPTGKDVIRIVPVITGSKRAGVLQTIAGAVLIVAGAFISGASGGAASPFGAALISAGIGLAAGGVVQMLSPQTKALASQDGPNNKASYSFNGPVNTSAQGNPVPVLYGEMIVGSAVISAGIYAEDQQ